MLSSDFHPEMAKEAIRAEPDQTRRLIIILGFCALGLVFGVASARGIVPDLDLGDDVYILDAKSRIVAWWILCTMAGGVFGLVVVLATGHTRPQPGSRARRIIFEITIILGVLFILSLPAAMFRMVIFEARWARERCVQQLKQISLALYYYEAAQGCFPPAYVTDEMGRPKHSWRVLILPYFDDPVLRSLYDRYNFSEPWDGPNNRKLAGEMPPVYGCPGDPGRRQSMASYLVITGAGTAFPGGDSIRMNDVKDGTDKTIGVFELQHSGVNWMEPRDLPIDRLTLAGRLNHDQGVNALFLDGSVRFLRSRDFADAMVKALATIAEGEVLDPSKY